MAGVVPQLIITLSPSQDGLQAELPGSSGSRRVVSFRQNDFAEDCLRILQGLARSTVQIGEDGAPTQAQVRHWERHELFPDPRCPFCRAEGRAAPIRQPKTRPLTIPIGDGSVIVRRIKAKTRGGTKTKLTASLEELGL